MEGRTMDSDVPAEGEEETLAPSFRVAKEHEGDLIAATQAMVQRIQLMEQQPTLGHSILAGLQAQSRLINWVADTMFSALHQLEMLPDGYEGAMQAFGIAEAFYEIGSLYDLLVQGTVVQENPLS